ncbi:2-keto-4-pentenoate hydratase [Nocardia tengchongensis]|uniref:2-keto-4-pentenoate hydratase n=1 Tax=Nocardia tengchongensis TaxID=2055889 RepID=UPI00369A939D
MPTPPSLDRRSAAADTAVIAAADLLGVAARTGTPCAPVRDLIGANDVAAAYAVQELLTAGRIAAGGEIVGHKIGLTSPAVQRQLGVDQPDFGVLFDDMHYQQDTPVPLSRLLQPKVEAEVAFVLAQDLVDGPLDDEQIRSAVGYAVAALEVVDSRIAGWDITFGDTVADNASSGLFVLGAERRTLDSFDPVSVQMQMAIDGVPVSTGTGAACLGDPLHALAWLARTTREFGRPLRAGQIVLSGALGPMAAIEGPATVTAEITGLGSATATFIQE